MNILSCAKEKRGNGNAVIVNYEPGIFLYESHDVNSNILTKLANHSEVIIDGDPINTGDIFYKYSSPWYKIKAENLEGYTLGYFLTDSTEKYKDLLDSYKEKGISELISLMPFNFSIDLKEFHGKLDSVNIITNNNAQTIATCQTSAVCYQCETKVLKIDSRNIILKHTITNFGKHVLPPKCVGPTLKREFQCEINEETIAHILSKRLYNYEAYCDEL